MRVLPCHRGPGWAATSQSHGCLSTSLQTCLPDLSCLASHGRHIALMSSPAREDHRLCSLPRLPGNARHMGEVGTPLAAVQPVLPVLSNPDSLQGGQANEQTRRESNSYMHSAQSHAARSTFACIHACAMWAEAAGGQALPCFQTIPDGKLCHPQSGHAACSSRDHSCLIATWPRGSASGGMGPKWSPGTVTMMRPDAALARPARTALSVVKASSGRSLSLTFCISHVDAPFRGPKGSDS